MRDILYMEEGVASAVGTIFAILIFVSILSIFVSTYVPATMMADEEQYSSQMMNSMVQVASTITQLSLNYRQGETVLVPFDLESGYVPIFSSPTYGYINISSDTPSQEGYLTLGVYNGSISSTKIVGSNITVGGAIMAFTNNRYFTDEAWTYEFSSLYYFNPHIKDQRNSSLVSNFIQIGPGSSSIKNVSILLVNIIGGPNTISTSSPIAISIGILSKQTIIEDGTNISLSFSSYILQNPIEDALNQSGITSFSSLKLNQDNLSIYLGSSGAEIYITEVTIIIGMSSYNS